MYLRIYPDIWYYALCNVRIESCAKLLLQILNNLCILVVHINEKQWNEKRYYNLQLKFQMQETLKLENGKNKWRRTKQHWNHCLITIRTRRCTTILFSEKHSNCVEENIENNFWYYIVKSILVYDWLNTDTIWTNYFKLNNH